MEQYPAFLPRPRPSRNDAAVSHLPFFPLTHSRSLGFRSNIRGVPFLECFCQTLHPLNLSSDVGKGQEDVYACRRPPSLLARRPSRARHMFERRHCQAIRDGQCPTHLLFHARDVACEQARHPPDHGGNILTGQHGCQGFQARLHVPLHVQSQHSRLTPGQSWESSQCRL